MIIEVLKSKLHCVQVTEANLNYMGSITVDRDLLDAVGILLADHIVVAEDEFISLVDSGMYNPDDCRLLL